MNATEPGVVDDALPNDKAALMSMLQSRIRVSEVCQRLRQMIDPNDDHYVVQIELASVGVIPLLFDFLPSEDTCQLKEICETVSALCANINNVSIRKSSGLETGFLETSFNPVQDEIAGVDGMRKLVDLLDSKAEGIQGIAMETISICRSFNHSNTLSYLRCLVHDVLDKKYDRLEYIHALLSDIEIRDDAIVLLNQLLLPVLQVVKESSHPNKKDALGVMGTLSSKHPASAEFWCEEGALEPVVQILLQEDHLRSRAVHALWQLVRQDKALLHPESHLLGCDGLKLLEPLVQVIGWTKDKTEDNPDEQDDDYSDEALLLLKALAEQDEEVKEKVGDTVGPYKPRCLVM